MGAGLLTSRAIIGTFYARLEQGAAGWVDQIAMYIGSDQNSEQYGWLGQSPSMREWVGERLINQLRTNGMSIDNKKFESTLEVDIDDLKFDKSGQVLVRINELADRTNMQYAKLLSTLKQDGTTKVCYDGQYFYDTDHTEGNNQTNQSNKINITIASAPVNNHGSTTAPSAGEMQYAILQAIQTMYGFKDDQGEPMNENAQKFLVMVPTNLWVPAIAAVTNPIIDGNDTNTLAMMKQFEINVVPNPRLTWTSQFTVDRTDGNVKPFIRQEQNKVEIAAIAEGSELEFYQRKHHYGTYCKGNVGYGYWQQSVLATLV